MNDTNTGLSLVQSNEELLKLYGESARLGSENLSGSVPMLKLYTTNKSLNCVLANGKEPNDGWFFLTGNQEQFENPVCHILTISKGFKAEGLASPTTGEKKEVFNQILGGVIVDGTDYKPFLMYFSGVKLEKLWNFAKEVNKYTHAKPVGIPMFALTVVLSSVGFVHKFGTSKVVDFKIVKKGDFPELVTDAGQFVYLRDLLSQVESSINSLIEFKSTEDKSIVTEAEQVFMGEGGKTSKDIADEVPF